jgi:rRNA maturation endonuclease Nob1
MLFFFCINFSVQAYISIKSLWRIRYMIRLKCKACGKVWYTANTMPGQTCDDCGGELYEEEISIEGKN